MSGFSHGGRSDGGRRRALALAVAVALALAGCTSSGAPSTVTGAPEGRARDGPPAPVSASTAAVDATNGPVVAVDLSAAGRSEGALDVAGTPDGGAVVLLAAAPPEAATRVVQVSPEGEPSAPLALPDLAPAWNVHALPDGTAVVTGRLLDEDAVGYAVVDLATGAARTVGAVPLDGATLDVVGDSAVSPDGRTVWLYSGMLVDGTYANLLTGHDLASGELVASRDLFGELRATHAADQRLDVVGMTGTPAGTVILAVNAFRPRHAPYWSPMLLVYDAALEPSPGLIELAGARARVTATALATASDGTAFVLLRGWPVSTLVALPPGAPAPEPRLDMTGHGAADELAVDAGGRVVLPGPLGVRRIELTSGGTADVDLGCSSTVTIEALASRLLGGAWVLGGCFAEGDLPSVLWAVP